MATTNRAMDTVPSNSLQPSVPINADLAILDSAIYGLSTIEFATDANRTLTATECDCSVLRITDSPVTLTAGRDVVFPTRFPMMFVQNATAQTLTLKMSGQTGVTLAAAAEAIIVAGETDVVDFAGGGGTFTGGALTSALDEAKGADIASAATTDIGAATGNLVHVTGTTTITALGTVQAGTRRIVRFAGALTLTHNATSLILPTGANITTAANDVAIFVSEGSGNWRCVGYQRANGQALASSGGGSLTGFTSSLETAAPNNLINVSKMLASGGTTDQDAALQPTGNGSILGQTPDNTATGGNKRGSKAVDLQLVRSAATQVASGAEAFIGAGRNNTAGGANAAVVGGTSGNASASNAGVFAGSSGTASGQRAVVLGGNTGSASGNDSASIAGGTANAQGAVAFGIGSNTNSVIGAVSEAGGSGMYPRSRYTLQGSTTSATPVVLTTNAGAAAATNQVYFGNLNNRSGIYRGMIVARQTGNSGAKKSWTFTAHLDRDNGTLALVAAVTPTVVADSGVAWSVAVTADNVLKTLKVEATGAAATTIRWACYIDGQEVDGT